MQRAHKIRLNPTPEQEAYFRKATRTARFAYNWGLGEIKRVRALSDASLGAFHRQLRYKAEWYGGWVIVCTMPMIA